MSSVLYRARTRRDRTVWIPWAAAGAVVGVRLLWLTRALSADEAGFLVVGSGWRSGTSLYGDHWVDRPPLLVAIFSLAGEEPGAAELRLVGCVAAAVAVLAVAGAVRRLTGSATGAAWAAAVAAILLASPVAGSVAVNGELLAAPFVGLAALAAAWAVTHGRRPVRLLAAAGTGAAGIAAVLVKQNMVDGLLVAALVLVVAVVRGRVGIPRALSLASSALVGALVLTGLVAALTVARGTSLPGVWEAMYPFRAEAARVLEDSPSTAAGVRGIRLALRAMLSGYVALLVLGGVAALTAVRRRTDRDQRDLLALLVVGLGWSGWVLVAIGLGGNYWSHYLVQLALPCAYLAGVLAGHWRRSVRWAAALAVLALLASLFSLFAPPRVAVDAHRGQAVAAVADRDDGIVVLWGHATIVQASGLTTPYEHLWTLPMKVRDPDQRLLRRVLTGPSAPDWVVLPGAFRTWGIDTTAVRPVLVQDYRLVATVCGARVLLRGGVHRAAPRDPCRSDAARFER